MAKGDDGLKTIRYNAMVAMYFPILAYAMSTFDLPETAMAVTDVQAVAFSDSPTVVYGQAYEARVFLAITSFNKGDLSLTSPNMDVPEPNLLRRETVDLLPEGVDETTYEYEADFDVTNLKGEHVHYPVQGSFQVRRPTLVVESDAATALVRNSKNELRINIPGLEERELIVDAAGARGTSRQVLISPSADKAEIRVFLPQEGGDPLFLDNKEFSVIDPPRPELEILQANGSPLGPQDNLSIGAPTITLKINPAADFLSRFPEDARYTVASARISIKQGVQAPRSVGGPIPLSGTNDITIDLNQVVRQSGARRGDKIILRLDTIQRTNFQNRQFPQDDISENSRTFSFTLG